ncbi:MAG: hypothetical protein CMH63_01525 [Nanoarchaeota archaeon]|jgi:cation transporter-like permease|nr:hypothetical protein [Nanoarchaeota archaeon]|tara:strand:- start:84305 stop:84862 length:558 start_codon:yes stop_codon:yes gene_type:complete
MNLEHRILKESLGVLILASIISAFGGIGLEVVQDKIFVILPLLILFPALNGMVGNFGTIFASRYATLYHENKLSKKKFMNEALKKHYTRIVGISLIGAFYVSTLASLIAYMKGFGFAPLPYIKIVIITALTTFFLVSLIALIVIMAGNHFIKKKEDPDNTLIPITTSIADLGSMLIFSLLIYLLF